MDKVTKSKPWFLSRTIIIATGLIILNGGFLAVTYLKPSYETASSTSPVTPFSLGVLLVLNIAFDAAIIYARKIASFTIS